MADHKPNLSHDVVSNFLSKSRFTPSDLWKLVEPYSEDSQNLVVIFLTSIFVTTSDKKSHVQH